MKWRKKKGRNFWNIRERWANEKEKKTHLNVWFGLMVWVHPKMAKTASSTTGALVGAASQQPYVLTPYQPKSHGPNTRTRLVRKFKKVGNTRTTFVGGNKVVY
jgi:hypothetical protein